MKLSFCCSVMLVLLCVACKSKESTYHLPPAQMGKILMDVHTAEVYSAVIAKDSARRSFAKDVDSLAQYYSDIFAHYHITKEQFDESLAWYRNHPDDLDSVYNKILPELSRKEGVFKAKK